MSTQPTRSAEAETSPRPARWLPVTVDRRVRVVAWLSFIALVTIIATGGAVRLTDSGLGCPTWPTCTPDSLVPTEGLGYHSLIEFGNRMMTGLVGIIAVILLILVWRLRATRRDLWVLALVVVAGIVAEAIVGGVTVRTGLNPFIVGFHYVASLALVCVMAAFLVRMRAAPGPRVRAVPLWYAILIHVTTLVLAVTIVFGILTTGAGPHSGDPDVVRNGFDADLLQHIHAWPGYTLFALTLVLAVFAWVRRLPPRTWITTLLAIEIVQIGVGLYQARNGLPAFAVGVHMVLAALTAATMTVVVLHLKSPAEPSLEGLGNS